MNKRKINNNISYFKKENLSWPNDSCSEIHKNLINKSWNADSLFLEKNISDDHKSNSIPLESRDFQWNVNTASHLLKRTIVGSTMQDINELTIGKYVEMDFGNISKKEAMNITEDSCKKLLVNPNTQTYTFEIEE